ncbi:MAG: penicillin-binding protein 2 [Thermodesulfobacteriota bacterium]|nr:penicillin-binding protein 2 [Thermodesulfobacteriota bacterium]
MARDQTKGIRVRIFLIEIIFLIFVFILGVKAYRIQVIDGAHLSEKAEKEYTGYIEIQGKRGDIFDRKNTRLAITIDALSLAVSPVQNTTPFKDARSLAEILDLDPEKIQRILASDHTFAWIKKRISNHQADQIRALKIDGLFFKNDVIRFYPNRELAAQVIGFTGDDGSGLEGLEYQYNDVLKGSDLRINITKDARGRYFNTEKRLEDRYTGDSIGLTLDKAIQYISEEALRDGVLKYRAASGMAVVMKPDTGEILALAHYPGFNPNVFSEFPRKTWRNRAMTDPFEPGSTMKVFVAAFAMDKGFCTPKSIFFCENGAYKVGRYIVNDTHDHGWLTLSQIIKFSSNIGAVKISETTGKKVLFNALSSFGFGEKTGLSPMIETSGTLSFYEKWSDIDTGAISFGQGVSVSGIQLICAISAIANNGLLMKPLLVREMYSSSGKVKKRFSPVPVRQVVSRQNAEKIKRMMRSVVETDGTGVNAAVKGYSVCGKTGTAQKIDDNGKGYSKKDYTAVFAGFAPETRPEIAVLVVIDEPRGSHYGGVVAAPVFKRILSETFNYLNIPPDLGEEERLVAGMSNGG